MNAAQLWEALRQDHVRTGPGRRARPGRRSSRGRAAGGQGAPLVGLVEGTAVVANRRYPTPKHAKAGKSAGWDFAWDREITRAAQKAALLVETPAGRW
ncbi:hypothetical protein [Streptomyces sp. TRM49041]|uniref:hypothetical protein n=1 Tax=Streptomyces sp. TRM49041 TaxID=2603216 RepID=UPI0011EC618F|nr:hypothetical protein [Streptomyces sp. TRM49041]